MFFAVGGLFFILGWLIALNIKGAAERAVTLFAQFSPNPSAVSSRTLRIVGAIWIPFSILFTVTSIFVRN